MRNNENYTIDRVNLSHCVCLFSFFFFFFFAVRNDEFHAVTFEIKIIVRPDRCVYFFSKGRSLYDARTSLVYNILYARVQYISLSFI